MNEPLQLLTFNAFHMKLLCLILHAHSALWGQVHVAYCIRLRYDGEESHRLKLMEAEKELAIANQDLLNLRIAVRRGRELGRQLHGLFAAWRLAKEGQLLLSAHQAQQEQLQQEQLEAQDHPLPQKLHRRLIAAKKQLKRLKQMAKAAKEVQVCNIIYDTLCYYGAHYHNLRVSSIRMSTDLLILLR